LEHYSAPSPEQNQHMQMPDMSNSCNAVVFDIGGVVIKICHTWQEALKVAGVRSESLGETSVPLIDFPPFNAYQANEITYDEYLGELGAFLAISVSEAERTHLCILGSTYPGMSELIDELNSKDVLTGCLSNTNAPHWKELTETDRFAPIARLRFRAGSHELGFAKPDSRSFQAYIDLFDLGGLKVQYFDDAAKNVEAARAFDWTAYQVDPESDTASFIRARLVEAGVL
jgi:putative hydrolase of the HAD superfamily